MMEALTLGATLVGPAVLLLWLISIKLENVSIVDIFWGGGFVLFAWAAYWTGGGPRALLVTTMVTVWGGRLTLHLAKRNLGHGEDRRYAAMRRSHGPGFWWISLFTVFLFQGALMAALATAPVAAILSSAPLNLLDLLGALLFVVGFTFEAVGDWQLARFLRERKSDTAVMDSGLWRYTRHPNYFGDALLWWGLGTIAVAGGAVWALFAPVVMTGLLLKVSGVAMLEKTITKRRPAYQAYIERTNAFVPWFPKETSS